jgi:hypothetical protein
MKNWDTSYYGKSSSGGGTIATTSSSRNVFLLRNAFSSSNPDLRREDSNTAAITAVTTGREGDFSKMFRSDSAIDIMRGNHTTTTTSTTTKTYPTGPELFFTPTYDGVVVSPIKSTRVHMSRRVSPVSSSSSVQPYSIPVSEILLVTYDITNHHSPDTERNPTKLYITTLSLGHYDMDCLTSNGHDIVLAFLQASLPSERMVRDESKSHHSTSKRHHHHHSPHKSIHNIQPKSNGTTDRDVKEIPSIPSTTSSVASSCFDMDALQAKHLAGRAEAETWYEKIQRRYGHVVSNIWEHLDTCCNNTTSTSTLAQQQQQRHSSTKASDTTTSKQRVNPLAEETTRHTQTSNTDMKKPKSSISSPNRCLSHGITGCWYGDLEMDDNATECSMSNHSPPVLSHHRHINATIPTKSSPLPPKHNMNHNHTTPYDSPPRYNNSNNNPHSNSTQSPHQSIRINHMPSGLSVEPEPLDTESVR